MPTAPKVVAAAKSTFAPVSKTPTPTISGRTGRGGLRVVDVTRAATTTTGTAASARRRHCPRCALVGAGIDADEEQAEAESRDDGEPGSGGDATLSVAARLPGEDDDAGDDERHSEPLQGRGHVSPRCVHCEWNDRRRR